MVKYINYKCAVGLDLTNGYTLYQDIERFNHTESAFILFPKGSFRGSH